MFKERFFLTYIDTDGKREIYAPFTDIEEAKEARHRESFANKLAKFPGHNFKFKIKSSKEGWLKLDL